MINPFSQEISIIHGFAYHRGISDALDGKEQDSSLNKESKNLIFRIISSLYKEGYNLGKD